MIKLIVPTEEYLPSYREAYEEFVRRGVSTYSFTDPSSCDIFAKFDRYRKALDLPPDRVGEDKYWLVDDEKPCVSGAVTSDTPCAMGEWGRGYGTKMLALALEKAKERGISPVLITCNDDNLASARVMEKNGFTLADKVSLSEDGKPVLTRRYWKTIL